MSEFNQARREGKVKFGYDFNSLAEVTHLWGLSATKLPYKVYFNIPGRENAICLLISEEGGEGWKNTPHYGKEIDGRGWNEILRIDEENADPETSARRVEDELACPLERYVFKRETRDGVSWYKFYGVFKIDAEETNAAKAEGKNVCIYRRVSEVGECPKGEVAVSSLTASDFAALDGAVLEAELLDEIGYEVKGKKTVTGTVKVWPKQKFTVREIPQNGLNAICVTEDPDVLSQITAEGKISFFLLKRDIELGYFRVATQNASAEV